MKRIVVIVKNLSHGGLIVRGIIKYAQSCGNWQISLLTSSHAPLNNYWKGWGPDGVIGEIWEDDLAEWLGKLSIPSVDVAGLSHRPFPRVWTDDVAVGRLAARALLDRQFRRFAFFSNGGHDPVSYRRLEGFHDELAKAGFDCDCRWISPVIDPLIWNWEQILHDVDRWIASLPKPIGIMGASDVCAQRLVLACQRVNVRVPEEAAIIGTGNDPIQCELCNPPLASVILPLEKMGFEAARLLDGLMGGRKPLAKPLLLPPLGICTRGSCDVLAIDDPIVVAAMHFIRGHAHEPIDVENVLDEVCVSRRSLERRFLQLIGRSPRQEILRAHLERAKVLLRDTELKMPEVAVRSGFTHPVLMAQPFKRVTGLTPSAYRRQCRLA